jgi:hypothetical protein
VGVGVRDGHKVAVGVGVAVSVGVWVGKGVAVAGAVDVSDEAIRVGSEAVLSSEQATNRRTTTRKKQSCFTFIKL